VKLKGEAKPCPPPRSPGPEGSGQCAADALEVLDPVYPDILEFGETVPGTPVGKSLRLLNKTSRSLRLSVSDPRPPFTAPRSFVAPPGESALPVTFNPSKGAPVGVGMLGLVTLRTGGKPGAAVQAFLAGMRRPDWLQFSPTQLNFHIPGNGTLQGY